MKLYHFTSEKWALEALRAQTIKVSTYDALNDPFELLAMSLADKVSRNVMIETKEKINKELRILCCSKDWSSPLLWSHYGDKHNGVALELEVVDSVAQKITYAKDRTSLDLHALMKRKDESARLEMFKMYTTKYDQWTYEEEYRVQFTKDDYFNKGQHDFIKFDSDVKLVGFVLGPLNILETSKLKNHLPTGMEIIVTTTRIAFQSFNVVHQQRRQPFTLTGKG